MDTGLELNLNLEIQIQPKPERVLAAFLLLWLHLLLLLLLLVLLHLLLLLALWHPHAVLSAWLLLLELAVLGSGFLVLFLHERGPRIVFGRRWLGRRGCRVFVLPRLPLHLGLRLHNLFLDRVVFFLFRILLRAVVLEGLFFLLVLIRFEVAVHAGVVLFIVLVPVLAILVVVFAMLLLRIHPLMILLLARVVFVPEMGLLLFLM